MRLARVFRKPPAAFLFPGWLFLVLGGTLAVLLLMFLLATPWELTGCVDDRALPVHAGDPVDASIEKTYRLDVFASGSFLIESWDADRPYRIHIDRLAHWVSVRRVLETLQEMGVDWVLIAVRDDDGRIAELPFRLSEPWPELDANASAQDFVDAIR